VTFADAHAIPPQRIWDGILGRSVQGEQATLALLELDADSIVPEHSHPNEQLGFVVSGSVSFRVGDEERELSQGGTWTIPPNVPHEVHVGPRGAVIVDVFSPPREDWEAFERMSPRPHRL